MRLLDLRRTCESCPSQWEARTEDGEFFYARYRFGRLTYGTGRSCESAVEASLQSDGLRLGEALDGDMSTAQMLSTLELCDVGADGSDAMMALSESVKQEVCDHCGGSGNHEDGVPPE
jgi:hypothetical protein